jgi:L-tyrosine isonitrile synthase
MAGLAMFRTNLESMKRRRCVAEDAVSRDASRLLGSFNTWSFKREQPSDLGLLEAATLRAATHQQRLSFVLYWGKGPRHTLGTPDLTCLSYLASMVQRMNAIHPPGAHIELLLTDTHAHLNAHPMWSINSYFSEIECAAKSFGFSCRRLGSVVNEMRPRLTCNVPVSPSSETMELLTASASKWYSGDALPEDAAAIYFSMNMKEKVAVELAYPDAIFVTFNNSKFRILFPDNLPIFYMYSVRKGCAVKPWFMPHDVFENAHPASPMHKIKHLSCGASE